MSSAQPAPFSLMDVKRTRRELPARTTIHGLQKIGKSSFASQAPDPIFIQTEDGLDDIETSAFPLCKTLADVHAQMQTLYTEQHNYKTVVLDSADWLEGLIHAHVSREKANGKGIEEIGFGKGYVYSAEAFKEILDGLNTLRLERGMNVVVLCHSEIKAFNDPLENSYDRYQLKLHKQTSKLLQEWSDVIGFARLDAATTVEGAKGFKEERTRVIDTGRRSLYVGKSNAYDAGNRYGLPSSIPLEWRAYQEALDNARKRNNQESK